MKLPITYKHKGQIYKRQLNSSELKPGDIIVNQEHNEVTEVTENSEVLKNGLWEKVADNGHYAYTPAPELKEPSCKLDIFERQPKVKMLEAADIRIVSETGFTASSKIFIGDKEIANVSSVVIRLDAETGLVTANIEVIAAKLDVVVKKENMNFTATVIDEKQTTPAEFAEAMQGFIKKKD